MRKTLSPRAHRWAICEFRRKLARWTPERIANPDGVDEDGLATFAIGLDHEHVVMAAERKGLRVFRGGMGTLEGPDREEAMLEAAEELKKAVVDAFASAVWRAIRKGQVRGPEELAGVVDRVASRVEEAAQDGWVWSWGSGRYTVSGDFRAIYGWIGRQVQAVVAELEEIRAAEEYFERIRRERKEARASWADPAQRRVAEEAMARFRWATACRAVAARAQEAVGNVPFVALPTEARGRGPQCRPPEGRREGGAGGGKAEPVPSSAPPAELKQLLRSCWKPGKGGFWVLGGAAREEEKETSELSARPSLRGGGLDRAERIKQLETEATCGDPEREALARMVLARLKAKEVG